MELTPVDLYAKIGMLTVENDLLRMRLAELSKAKDNDSDESQIQEAVARNGH